MDARDQTYNLYISRYMYNSYENDHSQSPTEY